MTQANFRRIAETTKTIAVVGLSPKPDRPSFEVARYLQQRTPRPKEPRLTTPRWAAEAAVELGARMADSIAASGVHVVGDLAALSAMPASGIRARGERPPKVTLRPELGASALMGLVHASGMPEVVGDGKADEPDGAQPVPTVGFARAAWRRVRERVRGLVSRGDDRT